MVSLLDISSFWRKAGAWAGTSNPRTAKPTSFQGADCGSLSTPERILASVDSSLKNARIVGSLISGATNQAHLVRSSGRHYVLRIPSSHSHIIHSSLGHETINTLKASEAGLAPFVKACDSDSGVMLLTYINGKTLGPSDLRLKGGVEECTRKLRQLHELPPFENSFDVKRLIRHYTDYIDRRRYSKHPHHDSLVARTLELQQKIGAFSNPRPCHNDPMAKNFMRSEYDSRLFLIDFEFSGNGDPTFDLATLLIDSTPRPEASKQSATPKLPDPEMLDRITRAYGVDPDKIEAFKARTLINVMAIDVTWGLFSLLQSNLVERREAIFARGYRARLERAAYLESKYDLDLLAEKARGYKSI